MDLDLIRATDPEVAAAIGREATRQRQHLELIASENYVSPAVMAAQGSVLTNKYAEGLPGKRYYGGCEHVDEVENLAIARAKQLFGAAWANVQPHSGANANMAVQLAELKPGDVVLGMSLAHGGHLTHGSPVNVSGLWFRVVSYGLNPETELLDYDEVQRLAKQHRPKLIVAGASAYARTIDFARFRAIADEVGATLMADVAHIAGLMVAGLHPTSVGHAHVTTTTTHKTLRGPRGGLIVCDDAERGKRYDKAVFPGLQGGPLEHVIAAKAVAFNEALQPGFRAYQQQVIANAKAMGESLAAGGLRLITGGTDNHLLLVDVRPMGLTGKAADALLGEVGLTVNKNAIPNDPESPFVTSGIRVGSPAFTTRGMGEAEARRIGELIVRRLAKPNDAAEADKVRAEVHALCEAFPVPGGAAVATV